MITHITPAAMSLWNRRTANLKNTIHGFIRELYSNTEFEYTEWEEVELIVCRELELRKLYYSNSDRLFLVVGYDTVLDVLTYEEI